MATQKHQARWTCLSAVLFLVISAFAILATAPLLAPHARVLWPKRPAVVQLECSNSTVLSSHPQIFTYNRHEAAGNDSTSLMAQARRILDENAGNDFVQLRENGASPKRCGVSMLHKLHCLELLRRSALLGDSPSHSRRGTVESGEVGRNDHINHCFQYIAQVSELSPNNSN